MPNPDLTARIAATIRRVEGWPPDVDAIAQAVAEDLGDIEARAALAERNRIVAEVRAMAGEYRSNPALGSTGTALGAVVDGVADRINTLPDPNGED